MRVLIAEDEPSHLNALAAELRANGHDCLLATDGADALELLRGAERPVDLVLCDLVMPRLGGMGVLEEVKRSSPGTSVILMTGMEVSAEAAVSAEQRGADDYLLKPFKEGEVVFAVERALRQRELLRRLEALDEAVRDRYGFHNLVGRSPSMQRVYEAIEVLARHDSTVLITGETGTGKDLVARAIHFNSARRDQRFVVLNCGAIPELLLESELFGHEKGAFTGATERRHGKFEHANGGTILLDEVGDIPPSIQLKLLRVLETREFERVGGHETIRADVRLLAATNMDLRAAMTAGRFRRDLFYRLNVVHIDLPPLRQRTEDIPLLVNHFLALFRQRRGSKVTQVSHDAMATLLRHEWPGNVRELENVLERAVIMERGTVVRDVALEQVPGSIDEAVQRLAARSGLDEAMSAFERRFLEEALRREGGMVGRAAASCHITERTLRRKMRLHGLDKKHFRRRPNGPDTEE